MKVSCLFIAVFGLALIFGCSEDSTGPSGPVGVILPLTVGNTWEYEDAYMSPFDQTVEKDTFSISIIDSTIRQDSLVLYHSSNGETAYNDAKGLWSIDEFDNSPPRLVAKYPGYPGDIYNRITLDAGGGDSATANLKIESTAAIVQVPAGSFVCYKYTGDYISKKTGKTQQRLNVYYAPNIGIIKQEGYLPVDINGTLGLMIERKLLSYSLIH